MSGSRGVRRIFSSGACLLALVLLTACTGGGASAPMPSASGSAETAASSTPSPTPTPTVYVPASEKAPAQNVPVPAMPEVAKQQTKEGWEAFAKYYIDELNYMVETNDFSRLQKLTTAGCDYCREQATLANFFDEYNQWLVGGKFTLEYAMTQMAPTETGTIAGILTMSRSDSTPTEARGALPVRPGFKSSNWSMALYWYQGAWAVDRLELVK